MSNKYYANRDRYKLGFNSHRGYKSSSIFDEDYVAYKFPSRKAALSFARYESIRNFRNSKNYHTNNRNWYDNYVPVITKIKLKLKK